MATEDETQRLRFPLPVTVRIGVVGFAFGERRFRTCQNVREFDVDDMASLRAWEPEAIVAPLSLALSLADQQRRGHFELPSLNTAMIVVTSMEDSPLADHHRDLLWNSFRVPAFEQLRGLDGTIIARECEVHDGMHIEDMEAMLHPNGEIVDGQCACGSELPRLRKVEQIQVRRAAASAR